MLIVMSHNDNAPLAIVPIPEGCGAKRLCLGPFYLKLAAIALICGVRIPLHWITLSPQVMIVLP